MKILKQHGDIGKIDQESIKHAYQAAFYTFLDHVWAKIPSSIGTLIATVIIFLAGISMKSEWLIILVHFIKQFGEEKDRVVTSEFSSKRFNNLHLYLLHSLTVSHGIYFGLCGFLQWYFYIRQKDNPEKWKCQPKKFLTWKDERVEIILGTFNMTLGAIISGFISCHIMNGGYTTIYYSISDYGILYFLLSIPVFFLYVDGTTYYIHRTLHLPFFYKTFHKLHHRFKQPTPFSASAMHPVEFLWVQSTMILPLFLVPIHWAVYLGVVGYVFYYGIIDHSGIEIEAIWPWQPSSMFHDNHHEFFHVNFGFNTHIWDTFHGTLRIKDRIYNENIFYGRGKAISEATSDEITDHLEHTAI